MLNLQSYWQIPQIAQMCFQASEIACTLTAITDAHWERFNTTDFAYSVALEPPYINYDAKHLIINRQITNMTNTNIANTCYFTLLES